jgi:hypothetical protein
MANNLPTIFANPIITVIFITFVIFFVYGMYVGGQYLYPKYRFHLRDFKWSFPTPFNHRKSYHMSRMAQVSPITAMPLPLPAEVYHIADQKYTYKAAKCKCANYNGRLATREEVEKAYEDGAEWCSYGWTEGGYALYPTQPASYKKYKKDWNKKCCKSKPAKYPFTHCGRPGINGGKFNKDAEFGINCYGVKPPGYVKPAKIPQPPKPMPPVPQPRKDVCDNMQYKPNNRDKIVPFNHTLWSSYQ